MSIGDTIEGVLIDHDEDGFHLILSGLHAEYHFKLDEKMAAELQAAVALEISHWPLQKMRAQMEADREATGISIREGAYDPLDPKHPMYHDTMSEVWDSREGK